MYTKKYHLVKKSDGYQIEAGNNVYCILFAGVNFLLFSLSPFNSEKFYNSKYLFYIGIY